MKLVFCTPQIIGSGGVERVLAQRLNYFVEKFGYDVTIVTTENNSRIYKNKFPFFYFNSKIKIIDLKISYTNVLNCNFIKKKIKINLLKSNHLKKLNAIVNEIKPDILISLGDIDRTISYKVNYSCKKILEHHVSKKYFTGELTANNFFDKLKVTYREYREKQYLNKYDEFLVLTEEDKKAWGDNRIKVINNPLPFDSKEISTCKNKKIISVGRLEKEKGFDILIDVWKKVNEKHPDWILEIYGEGSLRKKLQEKIDLLNLEDSLILKGNEKNIQSKYLENSIYVMSSRYEGFGMVLIEAMSCGLSLVSFDCPCGPKDIIKDGENGFLVKFGNIDKMAEKINYLIENEDKRIKMGKKSKELSYNYSEEKIMNQWKELFKNLLENK